MTMLAAKLTVWACQVEDRLNKLLKDESGEANIIAIILVLAIVVALAIIFRTQISNLFNQIWGSIFDNVEDVIYVVSGLPS